MPDPLLSRCRKGQRLADLEPEKFHVFGRRVPRRLAEHFEGDVARLVVEPAQAHRSVVHAEIEIGPLVQRHAQPQHHCRLDEHRENLQFSEISP